MPITYPFTGSFVAIECAGCHMIFGVTRGFDNARREDSKTFFCPNKCSIYYPAGLSTEAQLQAELDAARAQATAAEDQLAAATVEAEGLRRAILRDRQRFANGVCPCCQRSFENVARHIAGQHPDYDLARVELGKPLRFACSCGSTFSTARGLHIHQGHMRGPDWTAPGTSAYWAHLTKL